MVPVFLNWMVLRPFYSQKMITDLEALLAHAQSFEPDTSADPVTRQGVMYGDYWHVWRTIGEVNTAAWQALAQQESIDDIDEWISIAQTVLSILEVTTVAACSYYQRFCDVATEDVPALMATLNGLRVITNLLEFGLRLDHCSRMADDIDDIDPMVYATP